MDSAMPTLRRTDRRGFLQAGLTSTGAKFIPIQRTNTVEEMARSVMFLASDDASAWHGSIVDVTSGFLD